MIKNKICCIYCIENKINSKKYIGQTVNFHQRVIVHKSDLRRNTNKNKHLQRAWNKYGEDNFVFYILEECSADERNELEIFYIKEYNTTDEKIGYNISFGGGGILGAIVSKETREKLSLANKGRKHTDEAKKKISEGKKGKSRIFSREFIEENSYKNTGKKKNHKTPNSSKYLGVSWVTRDKRWRVYFKDKAWGSFSDEILAAKRFDEVCWDYLKDLSKLNFPENYK